MAVQLLLPLGVPPYHTTKEIRVKQSRSRSLVGRLSKGMTVGGIATVGFSLGAGYLLSQPEATAIPGRGDEGGVAAPGNDVIVGAIPDVWKWGASGGIAAYSFGSTSCNIGTVQLDWVAGSNQHPVIPQNLYRLKDGRFEQIGLSWVKHGFCALQQSLCGACQPAGAGCISKLGIGCSDPYDANLNGQTSNLGPRSQINAATGVFPYPFTVPPDGTGTPTVLRRRVQVALTDLDPSLNSGAVYYAECQYIHPDDAADGNDDNNASYRKVNVGSFTSGSYNLSLSGATIQQQPAIFAWKANDSNVTLLNIDVPNDGRFWVGYRVTDNGDGTWHYEYAVQNLNSDRSGGSFSLPIPDSVTVTNVGFHDVSYHTGEVYSNTDWSVAAQDSTLLWETVKFDDNENGNALRWATMYNFRFDADSPPEMGEGSLGLFKPGNEGDPAAMAFAALVPMPICMADFNGDGVRNGTDLAYLLGSWGSGDADVTGDDVTDGADLAVLLGNWGSCK